MVGIPGATSTAPREKKVTKTSDDGEASTPVTKVPLLILYGSNAGTCKSMAEDLETFAGDRFSVTVQTMDRATEHLPKDGSVVIITPSYEGKPADNAKKFVSWLESSSNTETLKGIDFAVFGVGNSEWNQTFHRIPKKVDEMLLKLGAHRLQPAGFVDVKEDIVGPWEDWKERFVSTISGNHTQPLKSEELKVEVKPSDAATKLGGNEISYGFVRKNDVIATADVGPAKRHMEIELPEGATYRTGQ
jgi:cytochrome P450/NADPH-cytochrome P450 reductase